MSRLLRRVLCTFGFHAWVQTHVAKPRNMIVKGKPSSVYENHSRCCYCTAMQVRVVTQPGKRTP